MNVLVVDDQRSARRVLSGLLSAAAEVSVHEAATAEEAKRLAREQPLDVAFIDLRLTADPRDRSGLEVLAAVRAGGVARAVMVTALSEMAEIRAAMRGGAYDYILKEELCEEVVLPILEDARSRRRMEGELLALRSRARGGGEPVGLVGASAAMGRLRELIRRVAVSERPVLVTGPSGSGKELVVQALHALGPAPGAPLLDLNCGAIPEALIEAQLFGYEKGAYTGAERRTAGYFAAVEGGTLFLDEIAELPLALQARLLRVLETRRFRMVGATSEQVFSGRVIAATHADLEARVREGRFREDLFHRLDVLRIDVPALGERSEDIPSLVAHFAREQPRPLRFTEEALRALQRAMWPGNVRQLRNLVDRVAVLSDEDPVSAKTVEDFLSTRPQPVADALRGFARAALALPEGVDKLEMVERAIVEEAMALSGGNKTAAARLLGVHRKVIERRVAGEDG